MRANVRLPAPDGTVLVADVYPPASAGPAPVVVTRTPYDRAGHRSEGLAWARYGFGYVVQDVRGRYGSDGTWQPYHHERADGAELVDWVVRQPWCDGRIVGLGGSYSAYTAWTMAVQRPAAVRAVISFGAAMGLGRVKFDRSGIPRLAEHATWWAERAEARTSRTGLAAEMFAHEPGLIRHLPVAGLERLLWPELTQWTDVIDRGPGHAEPDAVRDEELAAVDAASLHVGGWYDLLVDETLHQWHTAGGDRSLLVGPWEHELGHAGTTVVGHRDHGPDARIRVGEVLLNWLRTVLDGQRPHPAARVFVVGRGWTDHDTWPPPTTPQTWHAHADGGLVPGHPSTAAGSSASASSTVSDSYGVALAGIRVDAAFVYDPADPYPSADPGADRSALLRRRTDAVRFVSAPLETALTIAGRPTAALVTDGGGDVVCRLIEVAADGAAVALTQGVAADARGDVQVALDVCAVAVPAGSRLLLELTASDFPLLARPLADDRYRGSDTTPLRRTVSRAAITLPIEDDR